MKLKAYQASPGVPLSDQIRLVENPDYMGIFNHLDLSYPPKLRLKIGELRKWVKRYQRLIWARRLVIKKRVVGAPILLADHDGRLEHIKKLELVAKRFRSELRNSVVVLGKSDLEFGDELVSLFRSVGCVVFGNNLNSESRIAHFLPMGRDFRARDFHGVPPSSHKQRLVYCNFSLDTHPIRHHLWGRLQNVSFLHSEHMGRFGSYQLSPGQFYQQLRTAKFCIAPRGNAFDTYRLWDCLYLGTIPIVVKEAKFHRELEDLPILFLESYEAFESLTKKKLEAIYLSMLDQEWNYEKLHFRYWKARIDEANRSLGAESKS